MSDSRSMRWLIGLVASCAACSITETGNPPAIPAQMGLSVSTSDEMRVSIGGGDGEIVLDQAWVSLGDVRFVAAADCETGGDGTVHAPGPFVADLAAASSVIDFTIAAGDYCAVRVPLLQTQPPLPSGAPAELSGRSVALLGRRSDGVPLIVLSRMTPDADVRSSGEPFSLDRDQPAVLLTFDVSRWFEDVDLDGLEPGPDGRVSIAEGSNPEQLDRFEENLENAFRLLRDADQDGELDSDEEGGELADGDPSD
ncbi:MAG: hypothetical protein IT379_23360 [Deltaproteobacteria bacterium]|nr:hypothetical protein [Deltaproteobacteria bacterium]